MRENISGRGIFVKEFWGRLWTRLLLLLCTKLFADNGIDLEGKKFEARETDIHFACHFFSSAFLF